MKKIKKIRLSILLTGIFGASIYIFTNAYILKTFVISVLSRDQRTFIKKYLTPYVMLNREIEKNDGLTKRLETIRIHLSEVELLKKDSGTDIETVKSNIDLTGANLSNLNNPTLEKYRLTSGFHAGIKNIYPGSGYIDFDKDKMIIVSSRGLLAFSENFPSNKVIFKQINNNIDEFINLKQFKKSHHFSIKDLLIFKKSIYISYTEEKSEDCWNTSIISGNIDYQNITFKKLFSSKECVHSTNNVDKEFEPHQSGGRLIPFDESNIIFSIGDYRSRHLAQNIDSVNGKLIKVNLNNGEYKIFSMGHRSPQGLYLDKENNFILETEHGPKGGDEINLLEDIKTNKDTIYNFGWPVASAGEHYGLRDKDNKKKYEKYPLYNSHSEHGFLEPLKSFVPSIAISELVKIGTNNYVVSSLKDKSLYFFTLKDKKFIKISNKIKVGERIRDLKYKKNNLYMFLEDTASIGILKIN